MSLNQSKDYSSDRKNNLNNSYAGNDDKIDLMNHDFMTENEDAGNMENSIKEKFKDLFKDPKHTDGLDCSPSKCGFL